jgi:hypothetical protein
MSLYDTGAAAAAAGIASTPLGTHRALSRRFAFFVMESRLEISKGAGAKSHHFLA